MKFREILSGSKTNCFLGKRSELLAKLQEMKFSENLILSRNRDNDGRRDSSSSTNSDLWKRRKKETSRRTQDNCSSDPWETWKRLHANGRWLWHHLSCLLITLCFLYTSYVSMSPMSLCVLSLHLIFLSDHYLFFSFFFFGLDRSVDMTQWVLDPTWVIMWASLLLRRFMSHNLVPSKCSKCWKCSWKSRGLFLLLVPSHSSSSWNCMESRQFTLYHINELWEEDCIIFLSHSAAWIVWREKEEVRVLTSRWMRYTSRHVATKSWSISRGWRGIPVTSMKGKTLHLLASQKASQAAKGKAVVSWHMHPSTTHPQNHQIHQNYQNYDTPFPNSFPFPHSRLLLISEWNQSPLCMPNISLAFSYRIIMIMERKSTRV